MKELTALEPLMRSLKMSYLAPAIPMLATGVSCLVVGMATEAETFLWMATGFIVPGLVLALLSTRHRGS